MALAKPPFDPELAKCLSNLKIEDINPMPKAEDLLPDTIAYEDFTFKGPDSNELVVSVLRRKTVSGTDHDRLGIYHVHGGGMMTGNRFLTVSWAFEVVEKFNAVCVTIEYRLAPAHPDPAPVEDCYAGLLWMHEHASELGIDPARILINGASAGGGLAAGVALLCRDRNGPKLMGQCLFAPMLDDRNDTVSALQFEGVGVWDRQMNLQGWTALLGEKRGTENVSIYASPARATDLSNLPPAYIDVGSNETFRDEDVQYAAKLWRDGVQCELHVLPGAFHGSDMMCPEAAISKTTAKARIDWIERLLRDS